MILFLVSNHIATDGCLRPFLEEYPDKCSVLLFLENDSSDVKIKSPCTPISSSNYRIVSESIDFINVTHVVVQLLDLAKIKFILRYIPKAIPLIWWTFGGDLYNTFLVHRGYKLWYLPPSYFQKQSLLVKFKTYLFKFYRLYLENLIINRTDAIIPCSEVDFQLARLFLRKDFKQLNVHNYSYNERYVFSHGNNVLIGNSASISNNHLYVLKYIEQLRFDRSELKVSFAYNHQSSAYSSAVRSAYLNAFYDKVSFENSFVTKEKYAESFCEYKAAIFGHWRQEALGNIHICFQMGIKVFLSKNSPLLNYYTNMGFKVFCLEEITQKEIDEPLCLVDKENNRRIYQEFVKKYRAGVKEILHNYFDV